MTVHRNPHNCEPPQQPPEREYAIEPATPDSPFFTSGVRLLTDNEQNLNDSTELVLVFAEIYHSLITSATEEVSEEVSEKVSEQQNALEAFLTVAEDIDYHQVGRVHDKLRNLEKDYAEKKEHDKLIALNYIQERVDKLHTQITQARIDKKSLADVFNPTIRSHNEWAYEYRESKKTDLSL